MALGDTSNGIERELIEYYGMTVRENYSLCQTLEKGVAYHHGKLPMHVRRTLEKAIADKKINTVVCTTTLLQGVNLPAQNVFIRNPHLYVKKQKQSSELTNYEMANLRGRAGRLLKDYIGRTFVMDEDEFIDSEGYEQLELFEDVTKELPSGYEQKFEEYKDFIEEALDNNTPVDATMKKYGYIISYIRQSVLKYGAESRGRMKNVGIKLTQKQVAAIILKLDSIDVPKEICYKNRYWDPLVLDYIYNEYDGKLPNTPMEKGAKSKLDKAMRFLRENDVTAEMYNKNIPSTYRKRTMRKQVADRQKAIEDILFCLRVKIYNNSCVIKQNIRFIEARKHTNDSYLISRYEDYTTEIVQIKKLLAEIWNIPYGITIYAKHNRKAFVQLRILELLLSDNIGHIELDECNKPALIKIDLTQSNSELKREFMIKWTHCISQVDGITRYLKYMNKKMMRYQRLITNVTDVKELKEIVENIKD